MGLISVRVVFYLVEVGYLEAYSFVDTFTESFQATIMFYIVVPIFVGPPFLLYYIFRDIEVFGIPISLSSSWLVVPYLWTVIVALVLYAADFWAEEEGEDRLVE